MEVAEFSGTVIFAISGVFAVAERRLDWFGAIVVGIVTAIGGGTMRDLILGNTPVFWINDQMYLLVALIGAIAAIALVRLVHPEPGSFDRGLKLADAAGLALFAVVGADITLDLGFSGVTAVLCGLLTGVGGGVIRDLLAGQTPLIMRSEVYATAALAGVVIFVGLEEWTALPQTVNSIVAMGVIFCLRLAGIQRDWTLPRVSR